VYEGAPHGVPFSHAGRLAGELLRFALGEG
jgi:hypothetical protein